MSSPTNHNDRIARGPPAGLHITASWAEYVMSPTILTPGFSAVKSRAARSGISPAAGSASVRLNRHGRGWHGTSPSSRMRPRTSSTEQCSPRRASSAWTRRWPYVSSESSKTSTMSCMSRSRRCAVADPRRHRHS
jgi:hypothetical protein